ILSPEFAGNNPTSTSLVNLMYYAILGRQSEAEGLAFWTNQLDSGNLSRAQLVNAFLRSVEGTNRALNSYYSSYLKREIDSCTLSRGVAGGAGCYSPQCGVGMLALPGILQLR